MIKNNPSYKRLKMKKVYFLENNAKIYHSSEQFITLFDATLFQENKDLNIAEYFTTIFLPSNKFNESIHSMFVYYDLNSNDNLLQNANNSSTAKHFIFQNTVLRNILIRNTIKQFEDNNLGENVYSYHINVGHGNCSILIDSNTGNVWLIDCSNFDYINRQSYQRNIDNCIKHIQRKFSLPNFKINVVFLTHPHFDHYSGMETLINNGFIDNDTVFYINQYYSMPNPIFNALLKKIANLRSIIVEPISANSSSTIDILYPEKKLVKSNTTVYNSFNPIIQNNPNNASIIFKANSKIKSFIFTGDIETSAWNMVSKCNPNMLNCNYYAISHHGSINGHIRSCPVGIPIQTVADCFNHQYQPVLMGRTNSYNGIPSLQVLNDFPNVVFSEKDNKNNIKEFLEIEWNTNIINWY